MGAVATAFTNAFKTSANTNPADCQALGATVESYVAAPRTHNNNAASSPTSMPTGGVTRSIGADAANAGYVLDAFGGVPTAWLRRANNTGASPTAVASADIIGRMNFASYYTSGGPAYSTAPASVRGRDGKPHVDGAGRKTRLVGDRQRLCVALGLLDSRSGRLATRHRGARLCDGRRRDGHAEHVQKHGRHAQRLLL